MPEPLPGGSGTEPTRQEIRAAFEIGRHKLRLVAAETGKGDVFAVETLHFRTETGEAVRGILTRPSVVRVPLPAVLYIHAHGNNYDIGADELITGRPALLSPLGPVFAASGFVSMTIDLPTFGERQGQTESSLAKALLWHGRSLAGQMLGELSSALDYLSARPDVAADRIAAFGISMGATFSYWLASVDRRIAALAHLCCYADFETMIASGAHDGHGIYLTIPGLLDFASNGEVAGFIAPRPQFIGLGARDPLTPPDAVAVALKQTRTAYAQADAADRLEVLIEPEGGHAETPAMRAGVLSFFERWLKS